MKIPDKERPWYPVDLKANLSAICAVKALGDGRASEDQQKIALNFIIDHVAWRERLSYYPDSPRDGDFAEGRRFVSEQLVKFLKLTDKDIEGLKPKKTN